MAVVRRDLWEISTAGVAAEGQAEHRILALDTCVQAAKLVPKFPLITMKTSAQVTAHVSN